jgi:beta-glucanase (GH16 family)
MQKSLSNPTARTSSRKHGKNLRRAALTAALATVAVPGLATIGAAHAAPTKTAAAAATTTVGATAVSGWKLDMTDDFNTLNTSRWNVHNHATNTRELSYLTTNNVTIDNGSLRIQAKKQSMGGRQYTSGDVDSYGKYTLPNYFRVEIKAKVPLEMGMWAAPMWFRPTDGSGGEIDLVETYGADKQKFGEYHIHHTIHTAYGSGHKTDQKQEVFPSDPLGWHTYTIEKTKGQIVEYVDGKQTAHFDQGDPSWYNTYYEAGKRWSLIMNLQVGGPRGAPNSTTNWAADKTAILIDHIYAWTQS